MAENKALTVKALSSIEANIRIKALLRQVRLLSFKPWKALVLPQQTTGGLDNLGSYRGGRDRTKESHMSSQSDNSSSESSPSGET